MFSNGRFALFFTTWISATLLLYWVRNYSPIKGFLWAWLLLAIAWLFQFYGMAPLPLPFYIILAIVYCLIISLPYLLDLILVKKRSHFLYTLIFPSSWALIEYLIQFTPYGSWGHTAYSQNTEWVKIKKGVLTFGVVMILTLGFGSMRLVFQRPDGETIRIASISAIKKEDQKQKSDPELNQRFLANQLTDKDIKKFNLAASKVNLDLMNKSIKEAKAGAKIYFGVKLTVQYLNKTKMNYFYQ